jgi:hypothetical protein
MPSKGLSGSSRRYHSITPPFRPIARSGVPSPSKSACSSKPVTHQSMDQHRRSLNKCLPPAPMKPMYFFMVSMGSRRLAYVVLVLAVLISHSS